MTKKINRRTDKVTFNTWIPGEVKEALAAIAEHHKAAGDYGANMTDVVCKLIMKEKKRLKI